MKFKLYWDYSSKMHSTTFQSDWIEGDIILSFIDDVEKTGRVKDIRIEDETGLTWSKKELKKLLIKLEEEPDNLRLYFDASFNKETYEAGYGIVLYYKLGKDEVRHRINAYTNSLNSNNEAEYAALYFALEQIKELKIKGKKLIIYGDSQGLLMQLKGDWPCYDENLNNWLNKIENQINELNLYPEYQVIPRTQNKEADKLANQALQNVSIDSKQVISVKGNVNE